jgi:hypothetical protein
MIVEYMWKVQTLYEDKASITLSLSGRLQCAQVKELRPFLENENRKITLDLREVDIVDRETVAFLSDCAVDGVELMNCPLYIEQWIAKERASKSRTDIPEIDE